MGDFMKKKSDSLRPVIYVSVILACVILQGGKFLQDRVNVRDMLEDLKNLVIGLGGCLGIIMFGLLFFMIYSRFLSGAMIPDSHSGVRSILFVAFQKK